MNNNQKNKMNPILKIVIIILVVIAVLIVIANIINGLAATVIVSDSINKEKEIIDYYKLENLEVQTNYLSSLFDSYNESNILTESSTGLTSLEISNLFAGHKININQKIGTTTYFDTTDMNLNQSFIYYDINTKKFITCITAEKNGIYYVETATGNTDTGIPVITLSSNDVWACSNGNNSWE